MTSHDEIKARVDAVTPGVMRGFVAFTFDEMASVLDECAAKDAEIERLTSIANINATTIDAAQAECASLRARLDAARKDGE